MGKLYSNLMRLCGSCDGDRCKRTKQRDQPVDIENVTRRITKKRKRTKRHGLDTSFYHSVRELRKHEWNLNAISSASSSLHDSYESYEEDVWLSTQERDFVDSSNNEMQDTAEAVKHVKISDQCRVQQETNTSSSKYESYHPQTSQNI